MKIGILTHFYVKNFGTYLQTVGLVSTLGKIYPDATIEIINYRVGEHAFLNNIHYFGMKPGRGDTLKGLFLKIRLFFTFQRYTKMLQLSKKMTSSVDINKGKYDLIIVGSDEVWSFSDISYDPIKFGKGINETLIAYAVSVGGSSVNGTLPQEVRECIKKFKAISVRDEKSEEVVVEITGEKPLRTLDPIFLCDFKLEISKRIKKICTEKRYILIYDCHIPESEIKEIVLFAKRNNLNILGAGEYRKWYSSYDTVNITPFEWIYLFKNAYYIITGTFHGTAFSIKYNKNFVAYLTEINRVFKVESLLKEFGLSMRIVSSGEANKIITVLEQSIDYGNPNINLDKKLNQSLQFLKDNIIKL